MAKLNPYVLTVLFAAIFVGCGGDNRTAKTGSSSVEKEMSSVSGSSCLAEYAKRPCEILTEELLRASLPAAPSSIKKQEIKSSFSSCIYSWPSERKSTMTVMGRSMEIEENNQVSLSWIKRYEKNAKNTFRRAYLPTEEEQVQAQKMFNKQLEKASAKGKLDARGKKIARGMLGKDGFSTKFNPIENLGSMASWKSGQSADLYVLDVDTKFQISTNVSSEAKEDIDLAVALAKAVINACK